MTAHSYFICHFYCSFSVHFCPILFDSTCGSGRSLLTSSVSISTIMSCHLVRPVLELVYHQHGICRMYPEENPQDFRFPVPRLYS